MSRLNTFKSTKSQDIIALNKDTTFLAKKRSEKAREARTNRFDKNREISHMETNEPVRPTAVERSRELMEWRKKKELEKQKKVASKRPFLPSGPAAPNTTKASSAAVSTRLHSSRTLHNSLSSNSNQNKASMKNDNPSTSMRVTRSQVKREKEEQAATTSLPLPDTQPTYVVDEQELAWIPEGNLEEMNLKVRRKSLRFSEVFSKSARSPFVFRARPDPPKPAIPTIREDPIELSPINSDTSRMNHSNSTVNRNLLGDFTADDDTYILEAQNSEIPVMDNDVTVTENILKDSLIVTPAPVIRETDSTTESQSGVQNDTGIDVYSCLLKNTWDDLLSQCDRWKGTLNTLTEACDNIRAAIGHTELVMNKRFPQYAGLIQDARDNPGNLDLETRCSDLEGFWDLMWREVEDLQGKYGKLFRLAENGYQAVKSTHKLDRKPVRKPVLKPKKESTRVSCVTRSSSNSLREHMLRGREQMKEQQKEQDGVMMAHQKN